MSAKSEIAPEFSDGQFLHFVTCDILLCNQAPAYAVHHGSVSVPSQDELEGLWQEGQVKVKVTASHSRY